MCNTWWQHNLRFCINVLWLDWSKGNRQHLRQRHLDWFLRWLAHKWFSTWFRQRIGAPITEDDRETNQHAVCQCKYQYQYTEITWSEMCTLIVSTIVVTPKLYSHISEFIDAPHSYNVKVNGFYLCVERASIHKDGRYAAGVKDTFLVSLMAGGCQVHSDRHQRHRQMLPPALAFSLLPFHSSIVSSDHFACHSVATKNL